MGAGRRVYTEEFKRNALDLVETSGRTAADVARDLGILPGLLNRWQRESRQEGSGKRAFTGHGIPRDEELARLQKENNDLRITNDILKKAVAIFSVTDRRS